MCSGVTHTHHEQDPFHPLNVANRAHGNQAEYAGAIIGLMVYIAAYAPSYTANLMMMVFTAARIVFTFGMIGVDVKQKNNKFRYYGAIGTYLFGTLLSVYAGATAFLGY